LQWKSFIFGLLFFFLDGACQGVKMSVEVEEMVAKVQQKRGKGPFSFRCFPRPRLFQCGTRTFRQTKRKRKKKKKQKTVLAMSKVTDPQPVHLSPRFLPSGPLPLFF
jgi:hypothetical protein